MTVAESRRGRHEQPQYRSRRMDRGEEGRRRGRSDNDREYGL